MQTDLSFCSWPRCHLTDNVGLLLGVRVVDAHHPESGNNINIVILGNSTTERFQHCCYFRYFHIKACKKKDSTSGNWFLLRCDDSFRQSAFLKGAKLWNSTILKLESDGKVFVDDSNCGCNQINFTHMYSLTSYQGDGVYFILKII